MRGIAWRFPRFKIMWVWLLKTIYYKTKSQTLVLSASSFEPNMAFEKAFLDPQSLKTG